MMNRKTTKLQDPTWLYKQLTMMSPGELAKKEGINSGSIHYAIRYLSEAQKKRIKYSRKPHVNIKASKWNNEDKNDLRAIVCGYPIHGKPYKSVLLMPGVSLLDFKMLQINGSINKNTKVTMVERDSNTSKTIGKYLNAKCTRVDNPRYCVLNRSLTDLTINDFKGNKFDFIYLDTCGQLTQGMIDWLKEFTSMPIFSDGCQVFLTFQGYVRGGHRFFSEQKLFKTKSKDELLKLIIQSIFDKVESHWSYGNSMNLFKVSLSPQSGEIKVSIEELVDRVRKLEKLLQS